ncbi:MAG: ubiquinol oxidase subunit II, partial [bacterium]
MRTKIRVALAFVIAVILFVLFYRFTQQYNFAVLEPQGTIASEERRLIFATVLLSLVIVLPVFALTIYIAWTYRQGNTKAKYSPPWDHNSKLEFAWWAVPIVIITVLATITWQYTHALDPYRPLVSSKKPLTVQVIALQWQWLF